MVITKRQAELIIEWFDTYVRERSYAIEPKAEHDLINQLRAFAEYPEQLELRFEGLLDVFLKDCQTEKK